MCLSDNIALAMKKLKKEYKEQEMIFDNVESLKVRVRTKREGRMTSAITVLKKSASIRTVMSIRALHSTATRTLTQALFAKRL